VIKVKVVRGPAIDTAPSVSAPDLELHFGRYHPTTFNVRTMVVISDFEIHDLQFEPEHLASA
jgi:hypothetical protein